MTDDDENYSRDLRVLRHAATVKSALVIIGPRVSLAQRFEGQEDLDLDRKSF